MTYDLEKFRQENPAYQNNSLREIASDLYDYHRPDFESRGYTSAEDWGEKEGLRETWDREDQDIMRQKRQGEIDRIRQGNMDNMNFVSRSVARGVNQFQAMGAGFVGLAGSATGLEGAKKWGLGQYQKQMEEAAMYPGTEFKEIGEASTLMKPVKGMQWAVEKLGENLPIIAGALVTGGGGGAAAKWLGNKAIQRGLATGTKTLVRRELARQAIDKTGKKITNEAIKGLVKKGGLIKGASKEALDVAQKQALSTIGKGMGLAGGMGAMEAGGMFGDVSERGYDDREAALKSLGFGMMAGTLEILGGIMPRMLGIFGKGKAGIISRNIEKATKLIKQGKKPTKELGIIGRVWQQVADNAPAEFAQESAQEVLSLLNIQSNDPSFEVFSKENIQQIIESGFAGAAVGGLMGGAMGALPQAKSQQRVEEETAPIKEIFDKAKENPLDPENNAAFINQESKPFSEGVSAEETGKQTLSGATEPITEKEPVEILPERSLPSEMSSTEVAVTLDNIEANANQAMVEDNLDPESPRIKKAGVINQYVEDPEYYNELKDEESKRAKAEKARIEKTDLAHKQRPEAEKQREAEQVAQTQKDLEDLKKQMGEETVEGERAEPVTTEVGKVEGAKEEKGKEPWKIDTIKTLQQEINENEKQLKKGDGESWASGQAQLFDRTKHLKNLVEDAKEEKGKEPWEMTQEDSVDRVYPAGKNIPSAPDGATADLNGQNATVKDGLWRFVTAADGRELLVTDPVIRKRLDHQYVVKQAMSKNKPVPLFNVREYGLTLKQSDLANVTTKIKIMGESQTLNINEAQKQLTTKQKEYNNLISCIQG